MTNTYDRLGRLTQQATANFQLNSKYNLAGQLVSESFAGGPLNGLSVTNGYDQFLRRTNLALLHSPSSTLAAIAYGYDAASRLQTVSDGNGNSANYSYLANSPLVSQIAFQQGANTRMTTIKQYDYVNRLTAISSQPGASGVPPVSFNYNYNAANQRTQDKLADGSYWVYQYDSLGQVTSGCKYFYDGTPVPGQQFGYSFDTIGNRSQTLAGGYQNGQNQRVANYSVNTLNQVTSRDYPGTNDIIGVALATNAVTVNGLAAFHKGEYFRGTVSTNNTAGAKWQQVTVTSGGGTTLGGLYVPQTREQFLYDADGNLTNDGHWAYTWDAENRLIGMTNNTGVGPLYGLTFSYDAKGRRIQKSVTTNGTAFATQYFLYDGWNLAAILNSPSSILESFVWGSDLSGSLQGAGGVGGLLEVSYYGAALTNCFPAFDGNGNLAALVNARDGTILASYEYGPFGEVIRSTGPMAKVSPFRFSTKYQDDESDLLYYGYRYYKPSTGTWLGRDGVAEPGFRCAEYTLDATETEQGDSGDLNLAEFVKNSPTFQFDAKGLYSITFDKVINHTECGGWEYKWSVDVGGNLADIYWIVQKVSIVESDFSCAGVNTRDTTVWYEAGPSFGTYKVSDRDFASDHPDSYGNVSVSVESRRYPSQPPYVDDIAKWPRYNAKSEFNRRTFIEPSWWKEPHSPVAWRFSWSLWSCCCGEFEAPTFGHLPQ